VALKEFRLFAVLVLAIATVGCTDAARTSQQISARLDRIDVLVAKKEWEAARSEMNSAQAEVSRLPYKEPARAAAFKRLNAQAESLDASLLEESRIKLENTHISIADLFAIFDADEVGATRSYTGKEIRVKGEVGMIATDFFDTPYVTLHSKDTEFSGQAMFWKGSRGSRFDGFVRLGKMVFVTCRCDGKSGNVIILTRCSLNVPSANGFVPRTTKGEDTRKCGEEPRRCA